MSRFWKTAAGYQTNAMIIPMTQVDHWLCCYMIKLYSISKPAFCEKLGKENIYNV